MKRVGVGPEASARYGRQRGSLASAPRWLAVADCADCVDEESAESDAAAAAGGGAATGDQHEDNSEAPATRLVHPGLRRHGPGAAILYSTHKTVY